MQLIIGSLMLYISMNVQTLLDNVTRLSPCIKYLTHFIFLARGQHIPTYHHLHVARFFLCHTRRVGVENHNVLTILIFFLVADIAVDGMSPISMSSESC